MEEYSISEIFYSVQGEGFLAGTPAIFIRFAGCNLHCRWCDTVHNHTAFMDKYEILKQILSYCPKDHAHNPLVIFTGGEPTIQNYKPLLSILHLNNFRVQIETNGTNLIYPYLPTVSPIVTVSPKEPGYRQRVGHEMKLVYTGQTVEELAEYVSESHFNRYSLQPLWIDKNMINLDETVTIVKEFPLWNLSLQTHKLIGGK